MQNRKAEFEAAAQKVVAALSKFKQIKVIAFHGSMAKGYFDRLSDLDLVAFCSPWLKQSVRKKALLPVIKKWYPEYEDFGIVDVFDLNRIKDASVFYFDIKNIKADLAEFKKTGKPSERILDYIYHGRALYDPQGLFRRWKKAFSRYPARLREESVILTPVFRATRGDEIKKALKRHNPIFVSAKLEEAKRDLIRALYALNKEYFYSGSVKWAFKDMKKFELLPPNCIKKLERFSALGCKPSELKEKIALLDSLAAATAKIIKKEISSVGVRTKFI